MSLADSDSFRPVSTLVTPPGVVGAARPGRLGSENYGRVIIRRRDSSESVVENERRLVEDQGIRNMRFPVDFACLTLADYDRLASEMDAAVGTTLQIHCTAR
ncbi:MAG: hypothetical protein CMN28_15545 [Salinisphaeraceae bacterium]|jgi:hypothetical protein|nr:hypothetical protein [Salinisphaeraceae bacterium]